MFWLLFGVCMYVAASEPQVCQTCPSMLPKVTVPEGVAGCGLCFFVCVLMTNQALVFITSSSGEFWGCVCACVIDFG